DIDSLARTVRFAVPETLIAAVTTAITLVAVFLVSPVLASAALVAVPVLLLSTRWYLRRAPAGYLAERAAYSVLTAGIAEPADDHLLAHDVRYAYAEGRDVLHGVSLDLRPGERLAVVGPSGAGKSTLGRLLAGIHGPRTGSVRLGGVALTELDLDELRGHV